ncbi:MAG: phosphotransferase family protein [bacterium]|nr:phosphotransferase family protein [bacterium]
MSDQNPSTAPRFVKQQRDLEASRRTITEWLGTQVQAPVTVSALVTPSGAGVSNETFLFSATWQESGVGVENEYVLRLHPSPDYQVFYDPEFRTQFDLIETLARISDVRVPRMFWYEDDPSPFGRPFFVMERIHGKVPVSMPLYNREGFLFDASPEQRRRAWQGAISQLAAIHAVPVSDVQMLDRPKWGSTAFEQQLNYWERAAEWGLEDRYPAQLDEMLAWLRANLPTAAEEGLSWGDARLGNIMFDANFDVAAMLDWEQACLIGPTADLAWWLFFDEMYSAGQHLPLLEGMGDRTETLDLWSSITGREPQHMAWHEVFVGYKMANLAIRTTVVLPSARGAAPAMTLSIVNGALARLDLEPLASL